MVADFACGAVCCGGLRTRVRVRDCVDFEDVIEFSYELLAELDMVGDLVVIAAVAAAFVAAAGAVVGVCCGDGGYALWVRVNWKLDTHMVACKRLLHLPSHMLLIERGGTQWYT
jgi:hypothetical protein